MTPQFEMKLSHASTNTWAEPLLGRLPLEKGETAPIRKCQAGSLEQKKELVLLIACRSGL